MKTFGEGAELPQPVARRLEELGERYGLTDGQLARLAALLLALRADSRAPTTVTDPSTAVDVHLADSLAALALDVMREARLAADMGAGAGFPGLPLALALPALELTLLESQGRKCEFMTRLCGAAAIENALVVNSRLEEWRAGVGVHDVVLARALAPQPVVLEYAAPLLRVGGSLVDWRGRRNPDEDSAAATAAGLLGLELERVVHVEPYAGARDHHLHLYRKLTPTPERFPRRAGMARKRPLGV